MPTDERYALRREYRVRAAVVACFALSVAGIIGIGALFPAFVRAITDRRTAEAALASIKNDDEASGLSVVENSAANYGKLITTLSQVNNSMMDSAVLQGIVNVRSHIKITSLSVSQSGGKSTIIIQGKAPTRDELLSFKGRLEAAISGSTVDLPISELAKSTDVPFSIQVSEPLP